jgi:hypothetical protein
MTEEQKSLTTQFEDLIGSLEHALSEAGAAASTARVKLTEIAALEGRAREVDGRLSELEAAVNRARDSLNIPMPSAQSSFLQLHALPAWEEEPESEPEAETPELALEMSTEEEEPVEHDGHARCLRLEVDKKIGSLDLKQVDAAVNEVPVIVDVALLDYDGRHATLKLWLGETNDPDEISTTLLRELRSRLGGEAIADIQVAFEDAA